MGSFGTITGARMAAIATRATSAPPVRAAGFARSRRRPTIQGPLPVRVSGRPHDGWSGLAGSEADSMPRSPIPDPRIEHGTHDVDHEVDQYVGSAGQEDEALHDGDVTVQDHVDRQPSQALAGEHVLDDDTPAEQRAELEADDGDDRDDRVPERVAKQDHPIRQPLGPRRRDVLLDERLLHPGTSYQRDDGHAVEAEREGRKHEALGPALTGRR